MSGPRERLVDAASELFHARSYGSVGIQDICDRAGVRRGSFYYYFGSKTELGEAVLERSTDLLIDAVHRPAFEDDANVRDQLARFVQLLSEYHAQIRTRFGKVAGCPISNLAEELSTLDPEMRAKVESSFGRLSSYYERFARTAMEQGEVPPGDARAVGDYVLAYTQGVLLLAKVGNTVDVIDRMAVALPSLIGFRNQPLGE